MNMVSCCIRSCSRRRCRETAPASIVSAIGEALSEKIRFDAILILRGVGSELYLS